jgi:hypothetical protein
MAEPPEHAQETVEHLKGFGDRWCREIAPSLSHSQRRPDLLGAASGDTEEVTAVGANAPVALPEIQGD